YYENLPHRYLELAIELEADRMANLVLKQAQVASEKEVVANERMYRVDDDVEGTATEKLYATAFRKHPYRWPTIGWMDDIRGLTKEDCLQFYRRYYAPNNAVVIVVGDFDEQTALEGIREHYGTYRAANLPEEHTVRETALRRTKPLQLFLPASTEKVQLGYRAPPFGHPDHVPFTLAHEVLFGGRASRIYRQLVNEQELASECRASIAPFVYAGLYEVWLSARPGQRGNAMLEIFDQEVDRITRVGVDAEELDRVKNRYELFLLQSLDSVGGKAEQIGFYETVLGTSEGPFERLEAIRQVTSKSVQRVCKKYLRPAGRVLLEVFPGEQAA
ncbi:MAG: pitrilysin family protein, partial [Myxococcota bacterium]